MKTLYSLLLSLLLLTGISVSAQDAPRMVSGGVVNGKATSLPKPEYPEALRNAGIEGIVAVNITIDEQGSVIFAEADLNDQRVRKAEDGSIIETPLDAQLRTSAEIAARAAKFSPTFLNNGPVQVKGKLVYNFVARSASTEAMSESAGRTINGGVLNGKATSMPIPEYPPAAKAVNAAGAVSVRVTIDETGAVTAAEAVSGHPLLRSASVAAALAATFATTRLSGQPVKVTGILTYNFVP